MLGLVRYKGELLLLATCGKAMVPDKAPEHLLWTEYDSEVPLLEEDRVRDANNKIIHSKKPYSFYDLIEKVSPGPRVELFAREHRNGWQSFGDEL
jgi:N6-adenosine-specific RNA methylase IME4